jgi:galactonate dehydratase
LPTYTLFGGKARDSLQVYANVNRVTKPRTPAGFATAALAAVGEGFRAAKAAPFDGFPSLGSPAAAIETAVEAGIASVAAMRDAVGPEVELMVDCHSFFDVALAERVAHRLEPYRLAWYEEPVPAEKVEETREIRRRGEVAWRKDMLDPPERFENGMIRVTNRPGFGVELNEKVVRAHLM